jgi:hypothetical protein
LGSEAVSFVSPVSESSDETLESLAKEMAAGSVEALVILGGNPAYSAPADVPFAENLSKVKFTASLSLIASTAFALLLVFFRHSRIDFWGVVLCVLMLSISALFYIIVGQYLFSRVMRLAPMSGYAPGFDAVKFLVLPIALSLLARLGGEARLYRAMFLEETAKDYVRTARAKGLAEPRVFLACFSAGSFVHSEKLRCSRPSTTSR